MRARITANINDNLWLWIGIFSAATVIFGFLRYTYGKGAHWGDLVALCGAITGGLIMMKSQEGVVHLVDEAEDEA